MRRAAHIAAHQPAYEDASRLLVNGITPQVMLAGRQQEILGERNIRFGLGGCRREKRQATLPSLGVRFADAALVFEDPLAVTVMDDESNPIDQRFVILGAEAGGRLLVVVYSWRGDSIRLISARRAEPHEREDTKTNENLRLQ